MHCGRTIFPLCGLIILKAEVDVNLLDSDSDSPLLSQFVYGYSRSDSEHDVKLVNIRIEAGADVNKEDTSNRLSTRQRATRHPCSAITSGGKGVVRALVEGGADVKMGDINRMGTPPCSQAAVHEAAHVEAVFLHVCIS